MKILEGIVQGSPEWLAARAQHCCASEAAAMLGLSKKLTRNELLRMKATGAEQEFTDYVRTFVLDRGHEVEALARPIAEQIIGDELFPVTGFIEIDGIHLLCSYDGLTMDETTSWENKSRNVGLWEFVTMTGDVPDEHWPQLEQNLLVSGAERCLFTCSDGTKEGTSYVWYLSRPERRAQLIAGWKQFMADVAAYQHVEVIPPPVADQIIALPALTVEIFGEVRSSNLALYRARALDYITSISTDLQTDEDFANAEANVKFCDEAEKRLELVKAQALSQTVSIDELFRTIDVLKGEMRSKRLTLEKLVTARKDAIRAEIVAKAQRALTEHIAGLNARIGNAWMPPIAANFAGVIKGKKTIDSLQNAADTELARTKVEADLIFERVYSNFNALVKPCYDYPFLFRDARELVTKDLDYVSMVIKARIAEHEAAEVNRLEAERERIRQEEAAKLNPIPSAEAGMAAGAPSNVAAPGKGNVKPLRQAMTPFEVRARIESMLDQMTAWQLCDVLAYCEAMTAKTA